MTNFKKLRQQKFKHQKELAVKMCLTTNAISQYETGKRKPNIDTMYKLAEILAVPVTEIMACFYTKPKEIEV